MAAKKAPAKKWEPKVLTTKYEVELDTVWGDGGEDYAASLTCERRPSFRMKGKITDTVVLKVGCHEFFTKAQAEDHWKGGVSRDSKIERPHAAALIAWADKEIKARGFKW
jgi:hypothetical protein